VRSRGAHTGVKCEWSSDVCSSDLESKNRRSKISSARARDSRPHRRTMVAQRTGEPLGALGGRDLRSPVLAFTSRLAWNETLSYKSEERRVGNSCRYRA